MEKIRLSAPKVRSEMALRTLWPKKDKVILVIKPISMSFNNVEFIFLNSINPIKTATISMLFLYCMIWG